MGQYFISRCTFGQGWLWIAPKEGDACMAPKSTVAAVTLGGCMPCGVGTRGRDERTGQL